MPNFVPGRDDLFAPAKRIAKKKVDSMRDKESVK
jgi:hypothetical protein